METYTALQESNKNNILYSILVAIKEKPLSIIDVARKFNLNRSTTRYYLGLLRQERMITFERQETLPGRPTLIKFNEIEARASFEGIKKQVEEYKQKMESDPITKELLFFFSKNKKAKTKEILEYIKLKFPEEDSYFIRTISSLDWLKMEKKIVEEWWVVEEQQHKNIKTSESTNNDKQEPNKNMEAKK